MTMKIEKIRYRITGYGTSNKLTNMYFDLHKYKQEDIEELKNKLSQIDVCSSAGYKLISSTKSLNIWFVEDGIKTDDILQVLVDFVTNTSLSLLYINDKRDSFRYLASIIIRLFDLEGSELEII